ncbi:MAG: VIT1/CCC1 transporter family protein [Dehalococcoidia bacterium]
MQEIGKKRKSIELKARFRELVFGVQDGALTTVGLLAGVAGATSDQRIIVIVGLTEMFAGAVSMGMGSFLSSKAEKEIFDRELREEMDFAEDEPYLANETLMLALEQEGLSRQASYQVVKHLGQERSVFVRTFSEKVLGLGSADITKPLQAALVMAMAYIIGALLPLLPYFVSVGNVPLVISVAIAAFILSSVGGFKGYLAGRSKVRSSAEFLAFALSAAGLGYGIGRLIEAV